MFLSFIENIFFQLLSILVPIFILFILLAIHIFIYKRRNNLIELINTSELGSMFNCYEINKDELSAYKKVFISKMIFFDKFIINGKYKDNGFTYFQIFYKFRRYSVLVFDAKKYDPKFEYIRITPQTKINIDKDTDLEWIKFNKNFINMFDNPATALEVVTPYFMELLLNLKNKYGFIEIRYFSDDEYQKESLVILKRSSIFKVILFKKNKIDKYLKKLLEYLDDGYKLVNSI